MNNENIWMIPYLFIVVIASYDLGCCIGEIINSLRTKTEKHHEESSDTTEDFIDKMDSFKKEVFKANRDYATWIYNNLMEEMRTENDKRRKD